MNYVYTKVPYICTQSLYMQTNKISHSFIRRHHRVVSGIASRYTQNPIFLGVVFLSSIFSFLRIVTYRIGKFPFIMSDTIWDVIRLKHKNSEEAEERYKNYSLKSASIWFSIMSLTFVIWMIIEIIYLIQ